MTLAVSSLNDQVANLKKLGINSGRSMNTSKVKVLMIKDPDGNSIAFAEALDTGIAH